MNATPSTPRKLQMLKAKSLFTTTPMAAAFGEALRIAALVGTVLFAFI